MPGELFAEAAREKLAAFIEAGLPAKLAEVEVERALVVGAIGRPSAVIRGSDPRDPRDNKVEVYVLRGGPAALGDRTLFNYQLEVAFTLLSSDAQILPVQTRALQWDSAFWKLLGKGGSTLGGTVNAALCRNIEHAAVSVPQGGHLAVAVAAVTLTRQEP